QPTGAGGTRRRALLHVQVLLDQSSDLGDGVGVVAGHGDLRALVGTERHDEHGGGGVGGVVVGDRDLEDVVVVLGGLGDHARAALAAPSAMMSMAEAASAASSSAIEISMSSSYFSAASAMMPAGRACRPSAEPTVTVTLGMVSPRGSGCPVAASGGGSGGHG